MTPYYSDDAVTIYHGDCREWMPDADVVVTDPPYGISIVGSKGTVGGTKAGRAREYLPVHGDDKDFDPTLLLTATPTAIIWGANHFAHRLPPASRWLVWDKREGGESDNFADCELAWTNLGGPARLYHHLWRGMIARTESADGARVHPTQKPVALMRWCIQMTKGTIIDPFMGSGSTLRAAKDLGRKAIGIEIEERYCEVAAKRCSQEVLGLSA